MRQDLVHATRTFWRSKTTTVVAVLTLSLGIGFAVAVFSVADRVLFRPLPYPHSHRLVDLQLVGLPIGTLPLSARELEAARANPVFEQAEGFNSGGVVTVVDDPEPARARISHVTPGLLPMLGARLVAGRMLGPGDGAPGPETAVLLSHAYWRSRYGSDTSVVGRAVRLDGSASFRVAGILAKDFVFPSTDARFAPEVIAAVSDASMREDGQQFNVVARLKTGYDAAAADRVVPVDQPGPDRHIRARPLHEALGYGARRGLAALFAASIVLLLIAVLDVAGLVLAQATARDREIATRRAVGASTGRLVRLLLVEGTVLAAASCAGGLLAALWLFDTLMAFVPPDLQLVQPVGVDLRACLFALSAGALVALMVGLAPLMHLRPGAAFSVLRGVIESGGRSAGRAGATLLAVQVAAALVLLVTGGLLVTTAWRARTIDTGIRTGNLSLVSAQLPRAVARDAQNRYAEIATRIAGLPGVDGVAMFGAPLFENSYRPTRFRPVGQTVAPVRASIRDVQIEVSQNYFDVMGIPIIDGRSFTSPDDSGEAIVSDALARRWWPDGSPIGRQIALRGEIRVVVGVAGDVRQINPKMAPPGELYVPLTAATAGSVATLAVRARDGRRVLDEATSIVRATTPGTLILSAASARSRIAQATSSEGFFALLLGCVAAAAVGLAALGAYGLLDWSVARRRREIGIRAALGATPRTIATAVSVQLAIPVAAGALFGLALARLAAQLVTSLLFGVTPGAISVWMAAAMVLLLSLLAAAAMPAFRAARLSISDALRAD